MDINYKSYITNQAVHTAIDSLVKDKSSSVKINGREWTVQNNTYLVNNSEASFGEKFGNAVGLFFKYVFSKTFRENYETAKKTLNSLQGRATVAEESDVQGVRIAGKVKELQKNAAAEDIKYRLETKTKEYETVKKKLESEKNKLDVELASDDPIRIADIKRTMGNLQLQLQDLEQQIQKLAPKTSAPIVEEEVVKPQSEKVKPQVNPQQAREMQQEIAKLISSKRSQLEVLEGKLKSTGGDLFSEEKDDLSGEILALKTEIRVLQNRFETLGNDGDIKTNLFDDSDDELKQ